MDPFVVLISKRLNGNGGARTHGLTGECVRACAGQRLWERSRARVDVPGPAAVEAPDEQRCGMEGDGMEAAAPASARACVQDWAV